MTMKAALPFLFFLSLAGCTEKNDNSSSPRNETPAVAPGADQASHGQAPHEQAPGGRLSRTTRLTDSALIKSVPDEAGYRLSECPGLGGYRLRKTEADGRETVAVQPPGGTFRNLNLAEGTSSGFSRLRDDAEWRGEIQKGVFRPDTLILRHYVADDPSDSGHETLSLVPILLTGKGAPCTLVRISPAADQTSRALSVADSRASCPD